MSHPTKRMIALAERGLPVRHRGAHVAGQVTGADGPLLIYTAAAISRQVIGNGFGRMTAWAYITSDGRWGCGKIPQFDDNAGSEIPVTVHLRAVWHAIGQHPDGATPATVLTSNTRAMAWLVKWKAGIKDLPPGYTGRRNHGVPTLKRLQGVVAANAGRLVIRHPEPGDVLADGTDTLANLALRWGLQDLPKPEVRKRATSCADGFLTQWLRR